MDRGFIIVMVVFFILSFGGMFIMIKDEEACNHKVELKDGTIYDAKQQIATIMV